MGNYINSVWETLSVFLHQKQKGLVFEIQQLHIWLVPQLLLSLPEYG